MKLLLRSLILTTLCGRLCWSVSSDRLAVIQSPDDVTVMEGETVNISCCWTEKIETVLVYWLKNGIIIQDQVWQNKSQGSLKKDTNCFLLNFPHIRRNESGRYICRVFVRKPPLMSVQGTGTLVTLVALESTNYDSDDHNVDDPVFPGVCIYIGMCPSILFLVYCLFFYLRTKVQKNTPGSSRYNPRSVQRQEEDEG